MPIVGVKKLKDSVSQVVKDVREEGKSYTITYHKKPVAIILPLEKKNDPLQEHFEPTDPEKDAKEFSLLCDKIAQNWDRSKSTAEIMEEMRR